jgi:hypothetical protein
LKAAARPGWIILAVGVALLAAGVTVSVVRHNRDADARDARVDAQRVRFQKILRRTAKEPPRFQVSYVELPVATAKRLIHRGPTADTEVARRIEHGRVDPDFEALARSDDPISRALRAKQANLWKRSVVALQVTQTTPGDAAHLRLVLDRLSLSGFADVWDALDVLGPRDSDTSIFRGSRLGSRRRVSVRWTPRLGKTTIVPLSILHLFLIPRRPENQAVIDDLGGTPGFQVATGVVLAPIRLVVEGRHGRSTNVALARALHPVVVTTAPSGSS